MEGDSFRMKVRSAANAPILKSEEVVLTEGWLYTAKLQSIDTAQVLETSPLSL